VPLHDCRSTDSTLTRFRLSSALSSLS
jgi:hypothetical protein